MPPTATVRQISASVAATGSTPFGAHTHSGTQLVSPTDARNRNKQSVAIGTSPSLIGWAQSGPAASVVVEDAPSDVVVLASNVVVVVSRVVLVDCGWVVVVVARVVLVEVDDVTVVVVSPESVVVDDDEGSVVVDSSSTMTFHVRVFACPGLDVGCMTGADVGHAKLHRVEAGRRLECVGYDLAVLRHRRARLDVVNEPSNVEVGTFGRAEHLRGERCTRQGHRDIARERGLRTGLDHVDTAERLAPASFI